MPYREGFMKDDTFVFARGNGKSTWEFECLRKRLGISDEEWAETVRKARENLGWPVEES